MFILITPPHIQFKMLESVSIGLPASITVGEPGDHGAVVAGIHGIGVSTLSAAAVAAATVGFDMELHIAKGRILTKGLLSIIFAIGIVVIHLF